MRQAAARLPPPAPGAAGPRIRCRSMAARIALEADAQTETARPGRLPRLHQQRRRTGLNNCQPVLYIPGARAAKRCPASSMKPLPHKKITPGPYKRGVP